MNLLKKKIQVLLDVKTDKKDKFGFVTLSILGFFFFGNLLFAQEFQPIPVLKERITDLSGILSEDEKQILDGKLKALEEDSGDQIAILILPSTEPESIEQYSLRVVESWKLGQKGKDNGVLLTFAMKDRKMRIEVGYGLESVLPDAICSRIIRELITPRFREKKFFEGMEAGVDGILKILRGQELELPPSSEKNSSSQSASDDDFPGKIFINFFISYFILKAINNFFNFSWLGEIPIFLFVASIGGLLFGSQDTLWIFLIFGLIGYIILELIRRTGGSGGGYYSSGDSGYSGSSWGSSDSGGFFGGGGDFGGGGSSGSWD